MRIVLITVLAITLLGSAAWAGDPVGTYSVSGSNPGGGGAYSGTATVEKTGATYSDWDVAGTHFEGTASAIAVSRCELPAGATPASPLLRGDDWVACGPTRRHGTGQG